MSRIRCEDIRDARCQTSCVSSDSANAHDRQRWNELVNKFKELYGHAPSHVIRAPGRVNILGEHIDYSLFVSRVFLHKRSDFSVLCP